MNLGNFITDKAGQAYADFLSDTEKDIEKAQIKAEAWKQAAAEVEAQTAARIEQLRQRQTPTYSGPSDPAQGYRGPLILAGLGLLLSVVM